MMTDIMTEEDPSSLKRSAEAEPATAMDIDERPTKKQHLEPEESSSATPDTPATPATPSEYENLEITVTSDAAGPSQPSNKPDVAKSKKKGGKEYKGKPGKHDRVWEKRPEREGQEGQEKEVRLPKKKAALFIGFSGAGYNGMQYQLTDNVNSSRTIEMIVFKALCEMGAISKDNSEDPKKVDLSRAARTDAGVSAAGNVMSLKMIVEPPGCPTQETFTEKLNELLPPDIRAWGFQRTVAGFNARTSCDTRVYEYLFPTYCLLPPPPSSPLAKHLESYRSTHSLPQEETHAFWQTEQAGGAGASAEMGERKKAWRIGTEELDRFREIVKEYLGTHNFHNYTLFKPYNDKTVKRYMISINVDSPEVYGNIEWVSVKIHGQSFMLHQIRKMISLAILAARTRTPASIVPKTFAPEDIHIPKAPALGLLLEQPRFESYNARIGSMGSQNSAGHEAISFEPYAQTIKEFKVKHIYERLREDEENMAVYISWINNIDNSFDVALGWLNPAGEIPDTAIKRTSSGKANKGEKGAVSTGNSQELKLLGGESDDEQVDGQDD